ncbi:MAG: ATP-dependent Clp protease ATP-binding subunit ClpX, partial [Lachnospiraceae bacterium]|nr:ATP-dependent Clp protease ATP-binding subunit ClpX [Lachnospiraceae bacterium]MBQ9863547.1 ATP-dependent Clp protease ATP-binding subunit ClpX [Lachnospiraceae bacterium]
RLDKSSIGFNAPVSEKSKKEIGEVLKDVTPQDLIKFGLIPEFVGRVPINVTLEGLDEEAMLRILKEPKNALIKQYKKLFNMDNVELEFEDDAVLAIAKKAMEQKTGARGLRSILENIMMDVMFKIPSDDTIIKCTITKECVTGNAEPITVRAGKGLKKAL